MNIKLILIIAGGAVAYFGYQEFSLARNAKPDAAEVALVEIENGSADLSNAHVVIGPHMADYYSSIFEYEAKDRSAEEPADADKVNYTYYPILSEDHAFIKALDELFAKYPDGIPEGVEEPKMENLAVLVKTKEFATVGDIPEELVAEASVQGLFVNKIAKLDDEEVDLLRQAYPGLQTDEILLLEKGRAPAGPVKSFGMMGGGAALAIVGLGLMVVGRRD